MLKISKTRLKSLLKNVRDNGNEFKADCPKCGKDEFGISTVYPYKFGCYRKKKCGFTGNIFKLLQFFKLDFKEFSDGSSINVFKDTFSLFGEKEEEKEFEFPEEIKPPILWKRVKEDLYCESRFIKPYQFEKYKIGRSMINKNFITILIEMEGKVRGYLTRSDRTKKWHDEHPLSKRWDNAKVSFKTMLGGYDEIVQDVTKTVILVEGFFDKSRTDDNLSLNNLESLKCCFTFGGHITEEQVFLLKRKGVENIIILFESDIIKEIKSVSGNISAKFNSVKIGSLPEKRDPNQLNKKELIEILENLKDFVDFQLSYI